MLWYHQKSLTTPDQPILCYHEICQTLTRFAEITQIFQYPKHGTETKYWLNRYLVNSLIFYILITSAWRRRHFQSTKFEIKQRMVKTTRHRADLPASTGTTWNNSFTWIKTQSFADYWITFMALSNQRHLPSSNNSSRQQTCQHSCKQWRISCQAMRMAYLRGTSTDSNSSK